MGHKDANKKYNINEGYIKEVLKIPIISWTYSCILLFSI